MVATDWTRIENDAPADLVPCGYAISGLFDLTPLLKVSMNQDLRLSEEEAQCASPLFWTLPPGRTFDAVVGGAESSEFIRQSRIVADGWRGTAQTRFGEIAGANHFTVVDPLKDANSPMVVRLAELAKNVS
jgi:arylformamidase